ncbi:hypothetical protein pneo_cds_167 [Pandoravirus neocaledonia]|uniref:Uncharacterized protein n=1 Tax=Pandoravirus neocaledonia TaxID=2107708 RepID=A0A2U7UBF0_9VIRU|nr:hypothetical protein pneo_cds_167 [Pandoravirus neocaledonia]AVK75774.1 hypothetical protein pneo_cds_167 [Pandoravirus neocaledonia]
MRFKTRALSGKKPQRRARPQKNQTMASIDPVWSRALGAHPRVRAALGDGPTEAGGGTVPLFYRLGDLLRALGPPSSSFGLATDPVDTFLVDLFGLYLDWPSWATNQLVEAVDARLSVRESGILPLFAVGPETALGCIDTRGDRSNVFYLFVVWPPVRGASTPTARVSMYRVQRMPPEQDHGDAYDDDDGGDPARNLSVTGLLAQVRVPREETDGYGDYHDEIDEEYFDESQFVADAALYDFAHGTLADLAGVLPRLAEALAVDSLSSTAAPIHHTRGDASDGGGGGQSRDDIREPMGDRYEGASAMRRSMMPLVGLSPHLAREVMAQRYTTAAFEPSLAGARAVLVSPCQLASVLGMIAAADAARRLRVVAAGTAPRTLADMSIAAAASAVVPQGTRLLASLPEGIKERAAFATWQRVCSDAPEPITGRLARADRLVDVADALGVNLTDAQLRDTERLCPDLLDDVVRAGIAASFGAAPAAPRLAPPEHLFFSQPALALVRHSDDGVWSPYDKVDNDGWTLACGIANDARLTADEAVALLQAAAEQDEGEFDPLLIETMTPAVKAAAVYAETVGAPRL